jgi:prophage tail gpP-like protein
MAEFELLVNGRAFGGWKSVQVSRSMTAFGSFALTVSDKWAEQPEPRRIAEEDECEVRVDGETLILGYVGQVSRSFSPGQRDLGVQGADRAAELVENSALGPPWSYKAKTIVDIATELAAPHGVSVSVQRGVSVPEPVAKIAISPGDSPFDVIQRAARDAGVLLVSDNAGGIVITRTGAERAEALVEGRNMVGGAADFRASERFRRYVVLTQPAGTDNASGEATRVIGEAVDESVRRESRVLVVRPQAGATLAYARRRADWEARTRAATGDSVSVVVQGARQTSGALWPVNAITAVRSQTLGIDGEMLIAEAAIERTNRGTFTRLTLVRPDAFTPEPAAVVRSGGGGTSWKELAGGAL